MIIGHPGTWQQFQFRLDNKGLNVMEMKSKYLHEQYLFEAQMNTLNQIHQQNTFMNGVGGGPTPASEPTPPPPSYTTELRLTFNDNLAAVQAEFGVNPSLLSTWNAKFPSANFETISINESNLGNPEIILKGNTENAGQVADRAFANKTTIGSIHDVNANCIIETAGTESFSQSGLVTVILGAITSIDSVAFNQCTSLSTVLMPNLTSIGTGVMGSSAFYSCTSLETVEMDNLERIPDYTFFNCGGLANLDGFKNLGRVGAYSFAFSGLRDVYSDTLSTIDGFAFYRCAGVRTLELLTTDPVSIGNNAFEKCGQLNSISTIGDTTLGKDVFVDVADDGQYIFAGTLTDPDDNVAYLDGKGWTLA
jgi:hypothetical protein